VKLPDTLAVVDFDNLSKELFQRGLAIEPSCTPDVTREELSLAAKRHGRPAPEA
jgi:hypothetical protein